MRQSRSHAAGCDGAAQLVQGAVQPGQAGQVPAGGDRVGQARQSRNEAVHGWPGGLNGLFVKSRHAPVAVSSAPSASACACPAAASR